MRIYAAQAGLSTMLGAPCTPGLTDYLLGEQQRLERCHSVGFTEKPLFNSVREASPEPGELIGDSKFGTLIEQLRPAFDWIVIDTPPVRPHCGCPEHCRLG